MEAAGHGSADIIANSMVLIYCGAAVFGTLALFTRQVLPIFYIILGALIGPGALKLIPEMAVFEELAHIGIIFLLFLLGMDLYPQKLLKIFQSVTWVTAATSVIFFGLGYAVALMFGFTPVEALITAIATGFSSTIMGLKLLPTTFLHHRHMGELMIGILLIQDLLAILALILIQGIGDKAVSGFAIALPIIALPFFVAVAFLFERYVLRILLRKFDRIHEYLLLMTIAWCLGMAKLASLLGLSHEIGAFVAGVSLAASPIAPFITDRLQSIRDFFLVLFFVAMGAHFDAGAFVEVIIPSMVLASLVLVVKPVSYRFFLVFFGEKRESAWELGFRLGQLSEFSILIVFVAIGSGVISSTVANILLIATVLTFVGSSYLVVFRYPTPVAVSDRLRRD